MSQDTWLNWVTTARIPAAGEWCRETDTGRLRFGDGVTGFAGLRPVATSPTPEWVNLGPDTLRYLRALFARARSGTAAVTPIVVLGASVDTGVGSTGAQGSYSLLATRAAAALGTPVGGTGWVPAYNNAADTRWTASSFAGATALTSMMQTTTASGQAITFTSDVAGSTVQVALAGDSGACTVLVDGAAQTVTGTGGTAGTVNILTYTGLAATPHTVVITSTTAVAVKLLAVRVGGLPGIELNDWAISGGRSAQTSATNSSFGSPGSMLPQLVSTAGVVIIGCDPWFNDGALAANTAGTTANIGQAIADAQAAGHQVILTFPHVPKPASGALADWQGWQAAVYNLALTYGVPLLDMTVRWHDSSTETNLGYLFDNVHPTGLGYEDWAGALAGIFTVGGAPGPTHWDPCPITPALTAPFTAFGGGFYPPTYQKGRDGVVRLGGLVNTGTAVPGTALIFTLPPGYRPGALHGPGAVMPNSVGATTTARIDIQPGGGVVWTGASGTIAASGSWLSLEGLCFVPDQ